jgi:hypothetical protein
MSLILVVRDFNSDALGSTPTDLVRKCVTPNVTDWKIVESDAAGYNQALRVEISDTGPCIALFRATNPADRVSSESLLLFKATIDQEIYSGLQYYEPYHYFLQDSFIGSLIEPGDNPQLAIIEFWAPPTLVSKYPNGGIPTTFDISSWHVQRVRVYETGGYLEVKIKLWKYQEIEPEDWDYSLIVDYRNWEPGICFGIRGPGLVDFAYFSVGYGIGNPPQLPEATPIQWPHNFMGVPNASIGAIAGVPVANIASIHEVV